MKKWVVLIIACLFTNILSRTNISPQLSGPKGPEDHIAKSNLLPNEIPNLYPLSIGNRWVYLVRVVINPNVSYSIGSSEVISDSIAPNGKLYYCLKEGDNLYLYRVDSLDGKVYGYFEHPNLPDNEYLVAPLLGEVGETFLSFDPNNPGSYTYIKVTATDTLYIWGMLKFRKKFLKVCYPIYWNFSLTEDIGLDYRLSGWSGYSMYSERTLKGCIIDGVVYGDTTTVGVEDENNPIVSTFKLEQNYPNPFNPITKIKFTIPNVETHRDASLQIVILKVYDILGNEVTTLVNEELPAGEYEVEFDGTGLPSGIYFYQLKSGNFIQTKKMLLLK